MHCEHQNGAHENKKDVAAYCVVFHDNSPRYEHFYARIMPKLPRLTRRYLLGSGLKLLAF
jgi:hypothetical protein